MALVDFEREDSVNSCIERFNQKILFANNRLKICRNVDKNQMNNYKENTNYITCENRESLSNYEMDDICELLGRWFTKFGKVFTSRFSEKGNKWLGYGFVSFENSEDF